MFGRLIMITGVAMRRQHFRMHQERKSVDRRARSASRPSKQVLPPSKRTFWKAHDLKPHLVKTFKLSNDKHFSDNATDIVGRYLEQSGSRLPPVSSPGIVFGEKWSGDRHRTR